MRTSRSSLPLLGVGVALAGAVVLVSLVVSPGGSPSGPSADRGRGGAAAGVADRAGPVRVLRTWDRARARAWAAGDPGALRRLYTPGSRAGRTDVGLLRGYLGRGLRVTGMRMQVDSVAAVRADDDRLELRVTDRLVRAVAVGRGVRVPLPRDGWTRRRLVLVRAGETWRVAEVTAHESPAATTAETSGSVKR